MTKSMTGYGKATHEDQGRRVSVEVKSINAKHTDVVLRLPKVFSAQEITWRNRVIKALDRGKIVVAVTYLRKDTQIPAASVNTSLFKHYYQVLRSLAKETEDSHASLFHLALQFPDVMVPPLPATACQEDLTVLEAAMQAALSQCNQNRQQEGNVLASAMSSHVADIQQALVHVKALDAERSHVLKTRLEEHITRSTQAHRVDQDHLAQEVFYHIERLDITEEQVRLTEHLRYFEEVMQLPQNTGKKLGFIAQEIGREINTIGAKANHAAMQKEVILMKEALEKIKEQLFNIL